MKKRDLLIWLLLSAALFFAGWFVGGRQTATTTQTTTAGAVVDTIVYVDTVKYVAPEPIRKETLGSLTVKVPARDVQWPNIRAETDGSAQLTSAAQVGTLTERDSIAVKLPLEQSTYQSSDYIAYISGVNAKLDSITVYPTREVVTIKHPPKHWHLGVTAGYGFTPQGFQPYIGVGITYSFVSF